MICPQEFLCSCRFAIVNTSLCWDAHFVRFGKFSTILLNRFFRPLLFYWPLLHGFLSLAISPCSWKLLLDFTVGQVRCPLTYQSGPDPQVLLASLIPYLLQRPPGCCSPPSTLNSPAQGAGLLLFRCINHPFWLLALFVPLASWLLHLVLLLALSFPFPLLFTWPSSVWSCSFPFYLFFPFSCQDRFFTFSPFNV